MSDTDSDISIHSWRRNVSWGRGMQFNNTTKPWQATQSRSRSRLYFHLSAIPCFILGYSQNALAGCTCQLYILNVCWIQIGLLFLIVLPNSPTPVPCFVLRKDKMYWCEVGLPYQTTSCINSVLNAARLHIVAPSTTWRQATTESSAAIDDIPLTVFFRRGFSKRVFQTAFIDGVLLTEFFRRSS